MACSPASTAAAIRLGDIDEAIAQDSLLLNALRGNASEVKQAGQKCSEQIAILKAAERARESYTAGDALYFDLGAVSMAIFAPIVIGIGKRIKKGFEYKNPDVK